MSSTQNLKSNESVSVAQAGNTTLLEWRVDGFDRAFVHVSVTGQALDAFAILARSHPDATYETLYDAAADFTSPTGLMVGASGDLTALAAGATGWFCLDCVGLYDIKITASSGNVAGSTVSVYGGAS